MQWIPKRAISPIPGVHEWEAPDGMLCIVLPYTVACGEQVPGGKYLVDLELENKILRTQGKKDPKTGEILQVKDIEEYFQKVRMPEVGGPDSPKAQQEYCIVWDANTKELAAFYNYRAEIHTRFYKPRMEQARVHIFIDFGYNHPCAGICQEERYGSGYTRSHFHFHESFRRPQTTFDDFMDQLIAYVNLEYPYCEKRWVAVHEAVNPGSTGFAAKDGSLTPFDSMEKRGLSPTIPIRKTVNYRIEKVNELLNVYDAGEPVFNFNPSCADWTEMMEGGYRRGLIQAMGAKRATENPINDDYHIHLADAFDNWVIAIFEGNKTVEQVGNYKGRVDVLL